MNEQRLHAPVDPLSQRLLARVEQRRPLGSYPEDHQLLLEGCYALFQICNDLAVRMAQHEATFVDMDDRVKTIYNLVDTMYDRVGSLYKNLR